MDIQKVLDAMMAQGRAERSRYQLTLGLAIQTLEEIAPSTPATLSILGTPGKLASYRGYYDDLAFEPELTPVTVGEVLAELKGALGNSFKGYKGGAFIMKADTPLWVSAWGQASGIAIMDIQIIDGRAVFITKQVDQ